MAFLSRLNARQGPCSRRSLPKACRCKVLIVCASRGLCSKRRASSTKRSAKLWLRYCMAPWGGRAGMMSMMYQAYQNHMDLSLMEASSFFHDCNSSLNCSMEIVDSMRCYLGEKIRIPCLNLSITRNSPKNNGGPAQLALTLIWTTGSVLPLYRKRTVSPPFRSSLI